MSTPVYQQSQPAQNRPFGRLDAQGRVIPTTYSDLAYLADLNDGSTVIYQGWARPGTDGHASAWKICMNTYSDTTLTAIQWPQDTNGNASADYQFVWDNRADYNYS